MKKMIRFLAVLCILAAMVPVIGQEMPHDMANYTKNHHGVITLIPWYNYNTAGVSIDARYNFDWKDSFTLLIGKPMGKRVAVTPYLGVVAGEYTGVTAQVNLFAKLGGKNSVFTLNQVTKEVDGGRHPDYAFHYLSLSRDLTPAVAISAEEQVYKEPGGDYFVDIGPAVKFSQARTYEKLWVTVDPWHDHDMKFFLGLGVKF